MNVWKGLCMGKMCSLYLPAHKRAYVIPVSGSESTIVI